MEHAGTGTLASSPRAIGRLACGPHGACRDGNPGVEPPSDRSARLRPSWSTPERESRHRAPERSVGSLAALMEHAGMGIPSTEPPSDWAARLCPSWSMPRHRRVYRTFERIDHRLLACKQL